MASRTDKYSSSSGLNSGSTSSSSSSLSSSQRDRITSNASGAKVQNSPTVTKSSTSSSSSSVSSSSSGKTSSSTSSRDIFESRKSEGSVTVSLDSKGSTITTYNNGNTSTLLNSGTGNVSTITRLETSDGKAPSYMQSQEYTLNNYGLTVEQTAAYIQQRQSEIDRYSDAYKQFLSEGHGSDADRAKVAAAEARANDYEQFDRDLKGLLSTQQSWGENNDGSVHNMVGNSGSNQTYFDMYKDSLQYKTTQGNINDGATISLSDGTQVTKQYAEGYGQYYEDQHGNIYDVNAANTNLIQKSSNVYTYPSAGSSISAASVDIPRTTDTLSSTYSISDLPTGAKVSDSTIMYLGTVPQGTLTPYGVDPLNRGNLVGIPALAASLNSIVSSGDPIGTFSSALDYSMAKGVTEFQEGNYLGGVIDAGAALGANILLPIDLANTINKATKSEEITDYDIFGSVIDTIGLIPGVGWLAKGILKGTKSATKTASAAADVVKTTEKTANAKKFDLLGDETYLRTQKTVTNTDDLIGIKSESRFIESDAYKAYHAEVEGARAGIKTVDESGDVMKAINTTAGTAKALKAIDTASNIAKGLTVTGTLGLAAYAYADATTDGGVFNNTDSPDSQTQQNPYEQQDGIVDPEYPGIMGDGSSSIQQRDWYYEDSGYSSESGGGGAGEVWQAFLSAAKNYGPYIIIGICVLVAIYILSNTKTTKKRSMKI